MWPFVSEATAESSMSVIKGMGHLSSYCLPQRNLILVSENMAQSKDNSNFNSTHKIKPCFSNLVISQLVNVKVEIFSEQSSAE